MVNEVMMLMYTMRQLFIQGGYFVIIEGYFSSVFHKNISCRYSLEAPCQGASNEYLRHMFLWIKKTLFIFHHENMFV